MKTVLQARVNVLRQCGFLGLANFLLPPAVLVLVSFVSYLLTEKEPPGFVIVIVVLWMLACLLTFFASIFASRDVRGVWCRTYLTILPILGAALVVVPINWSLSPLGTGALFWAALAWTLGAVAASNILAWKTRRREMNRLLLPAGIGAAAFLLFHMVLATVFGAIALMSVIGDRIFVLPGQQ
jgi:hypothetical protein